MTDRVIVDSHIHLWDRNRFEYPWLRAAGDSLPFTFGLDDLRKGATRADRLVFIEAGCVPDQSAAEAEWASSQVSEWGGVVVAFAPVEDASLEAHLDVLEAIPSVTGVRRLLQDEPADLLLSPELARGVRALGTRGWSFDACVRYTQLPDLVSLASGASDTDIILDHLGKPPVRAGWGSPEAISWHQSIVRLARLAHTYVKLSGVALEAGPGPVTPQAEPFVRAAIDAFGVDRAMVGSDFPVSAAPLNAPSWGEWSTFIGSLGASTLEEEALLGGTALAVYFDQ